jgi:alpha-L-rhamnosidase
MAKIADVLDKPDDAQKYEALFERISQHFQNKFVDADGKIAGDSQTAYCMALQYDLLTEKQRQQAADHLVRRIQAKDHHLSVGFLGVQILLPTLTDIGRSDLAYRLLQNTSYPSWGYSVEQGATTMWERWNSYTLDGGINGQKMNSFNHYAYGACSEWMFYDMLGIDTAGSAYKNIKMNPQIQQGVAWAKGHYDSIQGKIASAWKNQDDLFTWDVTIPANTTATLHLPAKDIAGVTEGEKPVSEIESIRSLGTEGDRVLLEVGSGTYHFRSHLK